eukprot:CAMPEP_0116117548 /NCGR_PEP_ID=MMETSP0329-20121206/1630_1 /TAXON_ID=697910 /ORGANISM="Pseudo-nitzschia arenysensis, Strain B593" /LENGTH=257 /DNA_ID=CAMNT_0003611117 /DNA_START=632 /DNA_END=1402 /DNA_ORIENTATION=+
MNFPSLPYTVGFSPSSDSSHGSGDEFVLDSLVILKEEIEKLEKRTSVLEQASNKKEDQQERFPADIYSFIAAYSFMPSKHSLCALLFGILVVLFQIFFLGIMAVSIHSKEDGDFDSICLTAHDVNHGVRVAQGLSLLFYVGFPSSSLKDIISGLERFPVKGLFWVRLSCLLQILLGFSAALTAFVLVMISTTALDVVLNFCTVNFISEIANDVFSLTTSGIYGQSLQKGALEIENKPMPNYENLASIFSEKHAVSSW